MLIWGWGDAQLIRIKCLLPIPGELSLIPRSHRKLLGMVDLHL